MKQEQANIPISLFYSYAHKDEHLRNELEKHLHLLSREGLISPWSDRKILPGEQWAKEIDANMEAASVILLLVSPDFLASDYCYEIEMQHALERHKRGEARIIPIILRPCDWQHAPFAYLQCLPRGGQAVTKWSNQDEAFLDITQGLRRIIERSHSIAQPLSAAQRLNRTHLIKRVRTTWIEGLLEHSLRQATWLDMGLQEQPDALDNPWEMLVQELDLEPRPLPAGTSIVQVYDQADGRLLILGDPGAGKTTLLLQLTRTLLERAENDMLQPLPVVFVLSSWARKRQPLAVWLVEELKARYHISQTIAQRMVNEQQILPLLDGLDEVASNVRAACVQAINTYVQEYLDQKNIPLVVSCRSQEYTNLSTRVMLQKAVSILPLSKAQIEHYLQHGGKRVSALRQALQSDTDLAKMAQTPLLLNIFVLAYMDAQLADLPLGFSREETLQILFATYIKRMLSRRGVLRSANKKQAIERLAFLAKQMRHYEQTVFSVEMLQPDGLSKRQKFLFHLSYLLRIGLTFYLVVGLLSGLAWGLIDLYQSFPYSAPFTSDLFLNPPGVIIAVSAALVAFFSLVLRTDGGHRATIGGRTVYIVDRPPLDVQPKEIMTWNWSWKNVRFGLIWGFLAGPCIGLLLIAVPYVLVYSNGLALLVLLTHPIWLALLEKWSDSTLSKHFRERSKGWPWRTIRAVCFCLFAALVLSLEVASAFIPSLNPASLATALIIGVPVWLLASILKIASGERVMQRIHFRPNEGIKRSGRNGLLLGLVVTVGLCLPISLASWLFFRTLISLTLGLEIELTVGLSLGLFFGLNAFFQHYILRFWLWMVDSLPWNIVAFLDEMTERLFLRKIGGSYIFVHRFLLDYFATLTLAQQEKLATPVRTGATSQAKSFSNRLARARRVVTKKRVTALLAVACLFLLSFLIATQTQATITASFNQNATATADWQSVLDFDHSLLYPANFPGHGTIFLFSSLHQHDLDLPPSNTAVCHAQRDGYAMLQTKMKTANFCGYSSPQGNIAIRVTMKILAGDCGGIALRTNPTSGTGYFFYLCQNSTYGLLRDDSLSTFTDLIPVTTLSKSILPMNTVAIVALGNTLTLFLNGHQINVVQDSRYSQGAFGFAAFDKQQPTSVVYSNMRVWKVKQSN